MDIYQTARAAVERISGQARALAKTIWEYAELPYAEVKSAAALMDALAAEGFSVTAGVAGMPTCFTAACQVGQGGPAVGFLGEYDALDGLSQEAGLPEKAPVIPGGPGHGCGHNLLGAGCFAAAVALRDSLIALGRSGKVIFFGCPAEEGAGSKQFMARAGCFEGLDFALTWHPGTVNQISAKTNVAIYGGIFSFDGVSSHAGSAPHLGRSALDAAELTNIGSNYLREHMPEGARIHYAYVDAGGTAANVIPAHAEIKYEVRARTIAETKALFDRVTDVARGAALMAQTRVRWGSLMAFSDYTPNRAIAAVVSRCFEELGAPPWTAEEEALAAKFLSTYPEATRQAARQSLEEELGEPLPDNWEEAPLDKTVHPFQPLDKGAVCGSTDVGDVSYAVPTVLVSVATACMGNVGHSWQNTAFSCSVIGMKGMLHAALVLTAGALALLDRPEALAQAKGELLKKNGGAYRCPLPPEAMPPVGQY